MIIASISSPDPCDPNLMNIKYVQWLLFRDEARQTKDRIFAFFLSRLVLPTPTSGPVHRSLIFLLQWRPRAL